MKKIISVILAGMTVFFISIKVNAGELLLHGALTDSRLANMDRTPSQQPFLQQGEKILLESKDVNFLKARMITIGMPCVHTIGKPVPTPSVEELFRGMVKQSSKYTILIATPSQDTQMGCISISYMFIETSELPTTK